MEMTSEAIIAIAGVLMAVIALVVGVLISKGKVDKKSYEEALELIQKTTQLSKEEVEKLVETTDLLKDFVKENYHEGQEFAEQLLEFIEGLKKKGVVLKEVPVEVEHIVDAKLQEIKQSDAVRDEKGVVEAKPLPELHEPTVEEKEDIHRNE